MSHSESKRGYRQTHGERDSRDTCVNRNRKEILIEITFVQMKEMDKKSKKQSHSHCGTAAIMYRKIKISRAGAREGKKEKENNSIIKKKGRNERNEEREIDRNQDFRGCFADI